MCMWEVELHRHKGSRSSELKNCCPTCKDLRALGANIGNFKGFKIWVTTNMESASNHGCQFICYGLKANNIFSGFAGHRRSRKTWMAHGCISYFWIPYFHSIQVQPWKIALCKDFWAEISHATPSSYDLPIDMKCYHACCPTRSTRTAYSCFHMSQHKHRVHLELSMWSHTSYLASTYHSSQIRGSSNAKTWRLHSARQDSILKHFDSMCLQGQLWKKASKCNKTPLKPLWIGTLHRLCFCLGAKLPSMSTGGRYR